MVIEIGPVSFASAQAWLAYADRSMGALAAVDDPTLPPSVLETFVSLIETWRTVDDDRGAFQWSGEREIEEVEFLTKALFEAGVVLESANWVGAVESRPSEADEFHVVLVNAALAALEREGGSYAQFAECIRTDWGIEGLS